MTPESISRAIPTPWTVERGRDGRGWGFEAVSAEGRSHDAYRITRDEAICLAALQAVSPELLGYVQAAAEQGGTEAARLVARYRTLVDAAKRIPTPEERLRPTTPKAG